MDVATETLYSIEAPDSPSNVSASAVLKLVRLARTFRKVLITNPAANISIVGYLSKKSVDGDDLDTNLTRMGDRIKATRDCLKTFGVLEQSIAGYLPLQAAPITEDLIVVTARDTPKVNLFPGMKLVPVGDDSIEAAQGPIVVDPFLPPAPPKTQIIVGYTLIPKIFQGVAPIDPLNPLSTLHQFSFTITRPRHPPYGGGWEDTRFQGSVTLDEHGKIVNIQAGVQEALVSKPLLAGWIQASGFVQLMVSANWSKAVSGQTAIVPVVQGAVGGQILVTPPIKIKILDAQVQIGIQVMGTANLPAVPPQAAPFGPGPSGGLQGGIIINGVLPRNWL
jgi:hypothetical protein